MAYYELPPVGAELTFRHKGRDYRARIVSDSDGRAGKAVEYEGHRYSTLTAAAKSIVGRSINGWFAWKNSDGSPLAKPPVAERYRRIRGS